MKTAAFQRKEKGNMKGSSSLSPLKALAPPSRKLSAGTAKAAGFGPAQRIIAAHKYVSPRSRPLTPEEAEVRRVAYALKVPTAEACQIAAHDLAPLVDAAEAPATVIVLMPVPSSTGSVDANRQLANELAAEIHRRYHTRRVQVRITVGRMHPVESSCVRRRRGERGLHGDEHAMIRVAGPLTATETAYYFIDNMATTGGTLDACRTALGFGDGIVWADEARTFFQQ